MSLSSDQLDAFMEVIRAGSFSVAARRLHLSQSALSQRVLNLEDQLGQTLILRETKGLRLTDAGHELVRYCTAREALEAEALGRLSAGRPSRNAPQAKLAGSLRIAGYSTVMRSVILPSIAPLVRANPDVQIELFSRELSQLPGLLRTGEADFVVLDHELARPRIRSEVLGQESNVLVRPKSGRCPEDVYLDHDADDETTARFFELQKQKPPKARRQYLDEIYGILDGVAQGLGRAVVPLHLAEADPRVAVVESFKPLRTPVVLHYYEQPYYSALHHAVVEALTRGAAKYLI